MRGRTTLSVVIPVLDEAVRIGARLGELAALPGVTETIVVDGGSRDATRAIVAASPGVRLLEAPRGRGPQLNAGAACATGDVLLFLHADCALPHDAVAWIARALVRPEVVGGAFRTWHERDGRRAWVAPFLHLADVRSRIARHPYGDQAMFVRRAAFERVGGFPDQPLMEDVELGRRLGRIGRLVTVPASVRVSGRRFLAHPVRAILAPRILPLLYRLGVSPATLARLYGNPR